MEPQETGQPRSTDPAATEAATRPTSDAPRHALVLVMIILTAIVFVGLFTILYYRWAGAEEPSSQLVVLATPAFDGAQIEVSGAELATPHKVTIVNSREHRSIRFYLYRGNYTLRISRDDKLIVAREFFVSPNTSRQVDLQPWEEYLPPSPTTTLSTPRTD